MAKNKYSVILPTYNEKRNLPIVTWLLNRTFSEKYVGFILSSLQFQFCGIIGGTLDDFS